MFKHQNHIFATLSNFVALKDLKREQYLSGDMADLLKLIFLDIHLSGKKEIMEWIVNFLTIR